MLDPNTYQRIRVLVGEFARACGAPPFSAWTPAEQKALEDVLVYVAGIVAAERRRTAEAAAERQIAHGMLGEALRLSERDAEVGKRWRQRALDAEAILRVAKASHEIAIVDGRSEAHSILPVPLICLITEHLEAAAAADKRRW
jgi:hypothetical protein